MMAPATPTTERPALPSVSVIIPTFDRADDLVRAVRSCLRQTHAVLEVLVCDDGSTDASEERVRALGDPRVYWIPGPHAGRPAVPRNRGINAARGEWIAFLDSDDTWAVPDKLRLQFEQLARSKALFSCTNALRVLPDEAAHRTYFDAPSATLTFDDLLRVNRVICSSALVRADIVRQAGLFPEDRELRALEDYALWLRCAALTDIDYCNASLVGYADTPATSIRSEGMDVARQRALVLGDLMKSPSYARLSPRRQRAVARQLRIAQGVPTLIDRLLSR